MRRYSKLATAETRALLEKLISKPPAFEYRQAMRDLGTAFAKTLAQNIEKTKRLLLICTNEDADFLATGLLEGLRDQGFSRIAFACFWNDRVHLTKDRDVAPIVRRYLEPIKSADAFLVVKSIISSGCVVRTNISELVYDKNPARVLIVAPVILSGTMEQIREEFPLSIAEKFEFYWFAQDDERKENGEVIPGIGGSVYERLGVGNSETKNGYIPEIVKKRRVQLTVRGDRSILREK